MLAAREAGLALKAQAVLFRTAHHSGPLEIELVRRNIPFVKFGGLKFLEAAHVKDLLAVLRFAENPRDRLAGFRVLQLLPGVGPAAADEILRGIEAAGGAASACASARVPKRAAEDWAGFAALFALLRRGDAGWPAEIEAARLWYEPHLERMHEDAAVRRGDLLQLGRIAPGFASRSALPDRAHPRSAAGDQRPRRARRCATRTISSSPPSTRPRGRSGARSSC